MDNKGLIFIPDISGFTKFMHETELNHSEVIIQELLETIINANNIGLEISEIEGDAILFYKFGPPPAMDALYKQVEKMFLEFYKNIIKNPQRGSAVALQQAQIEMRQSRTWRSDPRYWGAYFVMSNQ